MRKKYLLGLGNHCFHRLAYTEWGDPANPRVLVCVHGLTRNGRDFDMLAEALADRWRVICPDMPGRGDSDWLPEKTDYVPPTYRADCAALIARLDVEQVDWLGTSMGGIIGIGLAAMPNAPIRRLILNDIGPFIPAAALRRIAEYVGVDRRFPDLGEAEHYLRAAMASFGVRRPEHWRYLAGTSTRPAEGGGLRLHYDPGIAQTFVGQKIEDVSFWPVWDAVRCPSLVLRGAKSDILLPETAAEMTTRGPRPELVQFPGCGHAPMLMEAEQIAAVRAWLEREE